jgi:hypothetical protein
MKQAKTHMTAENYDALVNHLVAYDDQQITLTKLLSKTMALLGQYPSLERQFQVFLPPSWTLTGPQSV